MNDITVTVIGNVASDVALRFTRAGQPVASFRLAVGTRRFDRDEDRWIDGDTHFFSVSCWRGLAHNVLECVRKGMPVMVQGRLRSREVQRPCGESGHTTRYVDIDAIAVGHDLNRGTAEFRRVKREAVVSSEQRAVADALLEAGLAGVVDPETGELIDDSAA
jgi:single-strand DNA-binding protein